MKVDLHNHTPLCNHAEGEIFQYVEKAIENRVDIFGISDHAPMDFDREYRMRFEDMDNYLKSIDEVAERYRDKITILKGFEVDYLPDYLDDRVLDSEIDYLIGSVHFLKGWGFDNPEFIGRYEREDINQLWLDYFQEIENMAKSGLFQIVGHIDLMKVFKFMPNSLKIEDIVEPSLKAIKDSGMAIEVNGAGYRKPIGEAYPSLSILKMIYEMNIPITFGSDAHKPEQVGVYHQRMEEEAKKIGFRQVAVFRNREMELFDF